ncbi:uncharacterized protein [Amphiura filiformis]|uniref:uncharacterized protein n=1 Tax=Amphiura filiformis TaxID=82378 RepID=UPI003B219D7F
MWSSARNGPVSWAQRRSSQEKSLKKEYSRSVEEGSPKLESIDSSSVNIEAEPDKGLYDASAPSSSRHSSRHHMNNSGHTYSTSNQRRTNRPMKRLKHPADQSAILPLLGLLVFIVVAIATGLPSAAFLIVFIPLALLIRRFLACRRCGSCACCASLLTSHERYWLKEFEFNKPVVQCILQLDGFIDVTRIRDLVLARVVSAENKNGRKLYPRFTQRIVPVLAGYEWIYDDAFNIDNHIVSVNRTSTSKADLECYISNVASECLTKERPLWELQVLALDHDQGKDTVLLFRYHPSFSDAYRLRQIFCTTLLEGSKHPPKARFGRRAFMFNVMRAAVVGPLVLFKYIICADEDFSYFRQKMPCGDKVVTWSEPISLTPVVRVKLVTRSTLNDVLTSAIVGSLRKYLTSVGDIHPSDIRASVIIDLSDKIRTTVPKMGQRFTAVNLMLPTNTEGAIPRLWEIRRRMDEIKLSAEHVISYGAISTFINLLPDFIAQSILSAFLHQSSCVLTNFNLADEQLKLAGRAVKMFVHWFPASDEIPISISVFTYADEVRLAIMADKAIVPDPHKMCQEFRHQIAIMVGQLAHRRVPGEVRRRNLDGEEDEDDDIDPLEEEIRPPSRPRSSSGCLTRFTPSSSASRPLSTSGSPVMGETGGGVDGTLNDESKDTRSFLPPRSSSLPPNARSRPYTPSGDFGQRGSSDRKVTPSGNKVVDGQFQFSPSVERRGSSTGVVEV